MVDRAHSGVGWTGAGGVAAAVPAGEHLRQLCFVLLLALPILLLFSRGASEVIASTIGVAFLYVALRSRQWSGLRLLGIGVVIWVFLNVIVSPFAIDPSGSFSRSLPWIRFVVFCVAVSVWVLRPAESLRQITLWMVAVCVLIAADVYVQYLFGVSLSGHEMYGKRLTGALDRPNIGMLMAKLTFPTIGLCLIALGTTARRAMIVAFGLSAIVFPAVFLTGERTATILSLIGLVLGAGGLAWAHRRYRPAAVGLLMAVTGVLATVALLDPRIGQRVYELVDDISELGASLYGQLINVAWHMFAGDPLTGTGLKNFRLACPPYLKLKLISECAPHPHNIYLEWLAESGAIGFVLFLLLVAALFAPLVTLLRRGGDGAAAVGFLLAALLMSFFPLAATQSFFSNWPALLLWLSVALTLAAATHAVTAQPTHAGRGP